MWRSGSLLIPLAATLDHWARHCSQRSQRSNPAMARDRLSAIALKHGKAKAKASRLANRAAEYRRYCRNRAARCYREFSGIAGTVTLSTFLIGRAGRDAVNCFSVLSPEMKRFNFRRSEHAISAAQQLAAGCFKPSEHFGEFF